MYWCKFDAGLKYLHREVEIHFVKRDAILMGDSFYYECGFFKQPPHRGFLDGLLGACIWLPNQLLIIVHGVIYSIKWWSPIHLPRVWYLVLSSRVLCGGMLRNYAVCLTAGHFLMISLSVGAFWYIRCVLATNQTLPAPSLPFQIAHVALPFGPWCQTHPAEMACCRSSSVRGCLLDLRISNELRFLYASQISLTSWFIRNRLQIVVAIKMNNLPVAITRLLVTPRFTITVPAATARFSSISCLFFSFATNYPFISDYGIDD